MAILYDKNWQKLQELRVDPYSLTEGDHTLILDCLFPGGDKTKLKLEVRIPEKSGKIIKAN